MARKSKEDAEKTRVQLLDSALIVMAEKGLVKTTLSDIASHAGVTRGAIYWHFKDKDDLLDAIWVQIFMPFSGLFDKISVTDGHKLPEVLIEIAKLLANEILSNQRLQSMIKLSHQGLADSEYLSRTRQQRIKENLGLEEAFERVRKQGRLNDHLTPLDAYVIYRGFINGIFQQWIITPESIINANFDALALSLSAALFKQP